MMIDDFLRMSKSQDDTLNDEIHKFIEILIKNWIA